jgi:hypothetical protein
MEVFPIPAPPRTQTTLGGSGYYFGDNLGQLGEFVVAPEEFSPRGRCLISSGMVSVTFQQWCHPCAR